MNDMADLKLSHADEGFSGKGDEPFEELLNSIWNLVVMFHGESFLTLLADFVSLLKKKEELLMKIHAYDLNILIYIYIGSKSFVLTCLFIFVCIKSGHKIVFKIASHN